MTDYPAKRNADRCPTHPGEFIADVLLDLPVSKVAVAQELGISRNHLHGILSGRKPVSPTVAVKLAAMLGGTAASFLRMQAAFDAWHAERDVDVSGIRRLKAA